MTEYHYKCPREDKCSANKHCHVLKTAEELPIAIPAIVKCPLLKKEIVVTIGKTPVTYRE